MESDVPLAPPVVAVVVVHEPGTWFVETLDSLAAQDYPNLNSLFLLTGGGTDAAGRSLGELIRSRLPDAFVRDLGTNPGYGPAANEVLRFVEGDSGFFCLCHDDVALEPDAIRMLVEELYRSNAGIIGPKLVSWDDAAVLQHVGLGLDRFGEVDPITEPGEYDQEQHDAVRDVFALPSACLLVRADLFRALGGFDPAVDYHGDDIDLCWRAHLSGARVVVAPQARVRHREELEVRRPDLDHAALRARHRVRTVATLTGGARLPLRSLELVLLTGAELVVGLFTGRVGEAWASLRATVGLLPRLPAVLARRGAIAKIRQVPDADVLRLHNRGSARLTSYLRSRETATYVGAGTHVRRWRESSLVTALAWVVVVAAILASSRTLIDRGVPPIGEFLPLPSSARDLWSDFATGWSPAGVGATAPNPTGWAVAALASVLWLFRMGLGLTVIVVGLVFLGVIGMWRLAHVFPTNRPRVAALVVYAAVPLVPGVVSTGRLSGLVAYAVVPWFVHLLRVAVGIGTADPRADDEDLVEGILGLAARDRVRRTAVLTIVTALGVAMAPAVVIIVVLVTVVLALATLGAGAGVRTAGWMLGLGATAAAGAFLLNLPWSASWSWGDLAAPELAGATGRGLADVAAMGIGPVRLEVLALALYIPVVVAVAVARAWRLTWAARAAGLVVVFGALAVLQDRDDLPVRLPDVGLLLAPVAVGLALAAAAAVASFNDDVAGRTFGWRQPAGLVGLGAIAVGLVPAVFTVTDGAWFTPRTTLNELVGPQLLSDADSGDFRVLFIGDPRLLPVPGQDLGAGVAAAVVDDGPLDLRDRWVPPAESVPPELTDALGQIASNATLRGGRLLAPFGIRYIVVPVVDGATSTADAPLPVPTGLVDSFGAQLDIALRYSPANYVWFENRAAVPTVAELDDTLAAASRVEAIDRLVAVDTSGAVATLYQADRRRAATGPVPAGTIHFGVPVDEAWELRVDGTPVSARVGFGAVTAYDVPAAGAAELRYRSPASRTWWLVALGLMWGAVLVLASRVGIPKRWRPVRAREETLIDLDSAPGAELPALEADGLGGWIDEMLDDQRAPSPASPAGGPPAGDRGA